MHIVFLTTEYPQREGNSGGIAAYTRKTAMALNLRGIEVSVIYAGDKNLRWKDKEITIYEIKKPNLRQYIDGNTLQQTIRLIRILITSLRIKHTVLKLHLKKNISIIQTPNYLLPGLFLINNRYKIPLVCRVSSYAPLLRSTYGKNKTFVKLLEDYFEYLLAERCDSTYSPSFFMQKIYKNFENLDIDRIATIIEDPIQKDYQQKFVVPYRKYILNFGSLSKIKGTDILAESIPIILNKYKEIGFVIVGNDYNLPNGYPCKQYILDKCNNSNRVLILDHQQKPFINTIIKNAYCVVAPSRVENLPNSCLETISNLIPIIGSKNSSIEEMVIDNKTGYLFKNGSVEDLVKKFDKILSISETEYKHMKTEIKSYYEKIKKEDRLSKLTKYYDNIIKQK